MPAFTNYFADEGNKEEGSAMIWDRVTQMHTRGMTTRDIAAYSFSAFTPFINNASPTAYFLLRHIFTHGDSLARLRTEVAPVFSSGPFITTLKQVHYLLDSCPLLRAFYHETLRLHAAFSASRFVAEETPIGDFTLKVGHNVLCPSYIQHHLPEYFGQNTAAFDPERFTEPALASGKPADPKMLRTFGGGVALCPGKFFASVLLLSYAASVLWRFDIKFNGKGMASIVPRKCESRGMSND